MTEEHSNEAPRWLDDSKNLGKLYRGLWVVCVLLLVGGQGLLVWAHHRAEEAGEVHHGFSFESWPGFYAFFGFLAYVILVLVSRELRKLVMRPEDYYGD